jgi:hypothetical protein
MGTVGGSTGAGAFDFNCDAPLSRASDAEILEALRRFAAGLNGRRPTMPAFDRWPGSPCRAQTVVKRLGPWRAALRKAGVEGGRSKRYTAEEMVENLERAWRKLGRRPGAVTLARVGRVSYLPYCRHWGSLQAACRAFEAFHRGWITREELLRGGAGRRVRRAIAPAKRFSVMERDGWRCVLCGRGAKSDPPVELEVDHIVPVSKGGGDEEENLRALCLECNRGMGDRGGG